jgi:outer membrane protein TolC
MRIVVLVVCLLAAAASSPALTLKEAVETAARQNPDILLARYRAAELRAQADLVRTGYLPQLAARSTASYQTTNLQGIGINFPGVPSRIPAYRVFDARPVLTQQVLDLSLLAQIRAARERERAAVEEIAALKERTLFAVAQLYLQALQADSRAQAVDARRKTASSVLDQVKDKESAGSASKLDIARATQEAERERTMLAGARREAAVLRTLLAQAIGLEDSTADSLEAVDLTAAALLTEEEAWKQARATRAEFRALDAQMRAAAQDKKAADREYAPKVGFQGDYGVLGSSPANAVSTYNVGGTVTVPIWTSGRIAAQSRAAQEKLRQVEAERRRTEIAVRQEVRQGLIERDAAEQTRTAAAASVRAAKETLELARLRFEAGLATNLDVTVALGNLAEAEDAEIRARYDALLARARLAQARGNINLLWEEN